MSWLKWLYPGIGIKRWMIIGMFGMLLIVGGIILLFGLPFLAGLLNYLIEVVNLSVDGEGWLLGTLFVVFGFLLLLWSVRSIIRAVVFACLPGNQLYGHSQIVDVLVEKNVLSKGPKIVAIGGGTGLAASLRGLRQLSSNITAIVTVADNGGSSGRLRNLELPAPGDIRNCILALANADEPMQTLFNYRYSNDGLADELRGHNFGNLLIATLTKITGDFTEAVKMACKILSVSGQVIPSTACKSVQVCAELTDGSFLCGETEVGKAPSPIKRVFLEPSACLATADALTAISEADLIIMGPGSLYTSVIATLLVDGLSEAIEQSRAHKVYICNAMTQANETLRFSVADHVAAIQNHVGDIIDTVFVSTTPISESVLARYRQEDAATVDLNEKDVASLGVQVLSANLVEFTDDNMVRHSPEKIAWQLANLLWSRKGKVIKR